ncbi:TIM-barrel domain-containing protein [Rubrivirga sp.]|uniref:glycoside hydrolase family 31 protein n=1 Tax=Rubrivirga sp. TaxID=1885344 RepID=UPI003B52D260
MTLALTFFLAQALFTTPDGAEVRRAPYVDAAGLVSVEVEHTPTVGGWTRHDEWTGTHLRARDETPFEVALDVAQPGTVTVWVLGRQGRGAEGPVTVSLDGHTSEVAFEDYAIRWTRGAARLAVPAGRSSVLVTGPENARVDKLVLAWDADWTPEGIGPPETTDRGVRQRAAGPRPDVVLPPAWAFGVLYGGYTDQQESVDRVDRLVADDYPIDAYWVDSWFWDYTRQGDGPGGYLDFEGDREAYPDVEAFWSALEAQGVKSGIWIWNTILQDGNEEVFQDAVDRGLCVRVERNTSGWHNEGSDSMTCDLDFESPEVVAYWRGKLAPFFDAGLDFLKLDRSADVPFTRTNFEATAEMGHETGGRGFVLAHLHFSDDPDFVRYPAKWSGDAKTAWSQPGWPDQRVYAMGAYRENVEMLADPLLSTSEIPFLSHDTGGFNFYGSTEMGDALYMRWVQFSAFAPVMHVFASYQNPTSNMPFNFGPSAQETFREYTHLRARLFPYRYAVAHRLRDTGEPMVEGTTEHPDQFTFGPAFLVAPVTEYGATSRPVAFPEGEWVDYWTGQRHAGGTTATVEAPMDRLPLFVRAGSIVPMRDYARSVEAGTNDHLTLDVTPPTSGTARFTLAEDDGTSPAYLDGAVGRTELTARRDGDALAVTVGAMAGTFDGAPTDRAWTLSVRDQDRPASVTASGAALAETADGRGWSYDAGARTLTVRLGRLPARASHTVTIR